MRGAIDNLTVARRCMGEAAASKENATHGAV